MRLNLALEEKNLDVRLRDRLLANGSLSREELDNYLNSLPDDAANCIDINKEEEKKAQEAEQA